MEKKNDTIHLLILDDSQNDAEQVVSTLRNSGKATRAHRVTSEEDFAEQLQNSRWDLFIARDNAQEYEAFAALAFLKKQGIDLPALLLTEQFDADLQVKALSAGAADAVCFDNKKHLLLALQREYGNLTERRKRREAMAQLKETEKRCELLLDSSVDAIAYVHDGMHIYANQSYMSLFGYDDLDELICIPIMDMVTGECNETLKEMLKSGNEEGETERIMGCEAVREDASTFKASLSFSRASYEGEACVQVIVRPESDDAELEEKLKLISSQDLLTGLYNKQYLMEQLEASTAVAMRNEGRAALLYISLDEFAKKTVDVGIAGADMLLSDISEILKRHGDENSRLLARLGDDTFACLFKGADEHAAKDLAEAIRKDVEDHLADISGRTIQITTSIGISLLTENAPKASETLSRAHLASGEVRKTQGHESGNGIFIYDPYDYDEDNADITSLAALQKALDDDRFKLLFQPIISLRGDAEENYETFLRMLDKEGNEIEPEKFLPPEGQSEIATKLDRWVILQCVKRLSAHRAGGHDTHLFVNLTPATIADKTFLPWLSVAMKAARLPGDSLVFEINEEDAVTYLKQAKQFVEGLRQIHAKSCLSRFGCAENPFNSLKHVNFDYVKVDGSFTGNLQKADTKDKLKEIAAQLKDENKLIIVPYVESATILSTLWQAGVHYIQGYYLQAPSSDMDYDFTEDT